MQVVTQLLSEEERGRKKETDGSGKKISSEEWRGGCNRVKKEEEDRLGIKRHQRAWEMVREGNGSDQFSHLLLLQFPQTTKCLQNPQLLLKKVGDRKAEPFSLGVPSFPSNKRVVSTAGWTAPWPAPAPPGGSALTPGSLQGSGDESYNSILNSSSLGDCSQLA